MFADMDQALREMGVGDLSVGKRVRRMWEAFHGRARAYEAALEAGDAEGLALALGRNVWRGAAPGMMGEAPGGAARRLAARVLAEDAALAGQPIADLAEGRVRFLPAPEVDDAPA
jgi:cytochrome b pre-mRNA-processing protein 3